MTRAPLDLERLRAYLPELDGRALVVLGYPHKDIGAVIREHLKHIDNPNPTEDTTFNPDFFKARLQEISEALEAQS